MDPNIRSIYPLRPALSEPPIIGAPTLVYMVGSLRSSSPHRIKPIMEVRCSGRVHLFFPFFYTIYFYFVLNFFCFPFCFLSFFLILIFIYLFLIFFVFFLFLFRFHPLVMFFRRFLYFHLFLLFLVFFILL